MRRLVGCIRPLEELNGPLTEVTVTYRAVERIAGTHRSRGSSSEASSYYDHRRSAPYRVVIEAAQRLGFLGDVINEGERGVTATIYKVP